jgi:NAD(P)H dehydrogenase (quinone)
MARVLVLYAHPVETSYVAALHRAVVARLAARGHTVDDCDLYAESFDPVLSRRERLDYHEIGQNRGPVAAHVERLLAAEALVIVSPVWNSGFPAILKGYLDRVFLPGVSFALEDGRVRPILHNIRALATILTYGGSRLQNFLIGDPPRKMATRVLGNLVHPRARKSFLAHYHMNRTTPENRARFLARAERAMDRV